MGPPPAARQGGGKSNPLGSAPILGLMIQFAIPSVVGMLVTAAYNITDQIFIGNLVGMLGNAATTVSFPIFFLTSGLSQLVGVGMSANFSINQGARQEEKAKKFVTTGLALTVIAGLFLLFVAVVFRRQILLLGGATEKVYPYALAYFSITAIGLPFQIFSLALSYLIRADGSPLFAMVITASGAGLNILLDWWFMAGLGWGIRGAAIATVIGQVVSAALCVVYLTRFKAFKLRLGEIRPDGAYTPGILKLGLANFVNHALMMVMLLVLNNLLTRYGAMTEFGSDIPLAVAGVSSKLNTILVAFNVGIALGCQPIWGFNLGAKQYDRVKETYRKGVLASLVIGLVFLLLLQLFPRPIFALFGAGDELYFRFAERYLRIYYLMVWAHGVQPLSVNYFTGTGNVKHGLILTFSRQGFLLIPLLLILPHFLGLDGILAASPIADAAATALSLGLVVHSFKTMGQDTPEAT